VAEFDEQSVSWHKAAASNSGNCVEVGTYDGSVLIRDSADPSGVVLSLSPRAWSAFLASARTGDLTVRRA
jgi:hypothetical protein